MHVDFLKFGAVVLSPQYCGLNIIIYAAPYGKREALLFVCGLLSTIRFATEESL